jgi:hypothetical protein
MVDRCRRLWPVTLAGLLWLAGLFSTPPSFAADPLAPLLACRALADSAARLACFDRESGNLAGAPASVAAPASSSKDTGSKETSAKETSAKDTSAKDNFGLSEGAVTQKEVAVGARPADINKIDAHLVTVSSTGSGLAIFTLDNGQVWRQIALQEMLARPGDEITVTRGLLHSYWLQIKRGRGCKVTRIP